MELAAEQRYWDSLTLALTGTGVETGAVYLLGYAVEVLLKTAYFRVVSVPSGQDIGSPLLAARRSAAWRGGNLHNLTSWFELLNDARYLQGNAWSIPTATAIELRVLTVSSHWRESLRYTSFAATNAELEEVFGSVDWLIGNYSLLWS